jgi:hypothetical protein
VLWTVASYARDFDTKHVQAMGLLARRFGARLSVKDRADFLDFLGRWLETRPEDEAGILALAGVLGSDPSLLTLEAFGDFILSGVSVPAPAAAC